MREPIYHDFGQTSPEELFRLHYEGWRGVAVRERHGRVEAIFNWLSTWCTRECPVWPQEPRKRKVHPDS